MQELAVRLERIQRPCLRERNIKDAKQPATLNKFKEAIKPAERDQKQCLEPLTTLKPRSRNRCHDRQPILADTQVKAYEQVKRTLEGIKAFYTDKVGDLTN